MRIEQIMWLAADSVGPGSLVVNRTSNDPSEQKRIGDKRAKAFQADASPSDLAHHHSYEEPSATDVEQLRWRAEGRGRSTVLGRAPKFRKGRLGPL